MDILYFIPEQLFILIASLNVMGRCLKLSKIEDRYIPMTLMLISILSSIFILGLNITSVLQGILCWGVSIGIHQTVKQIKK